MSHYYFGIYEIFSVCQPTCIGSHNSKGDESSLAGSRYSMSHESSQESSRAKSHGMESPHQVNKTCISLRISPNETNGGQGHRSPRISVVDPLHMQNRLPTDENSF